METNERVRSAGASRPSQAAAGHRAIVTAVATCGATAIFSLSLLAAAVLLALRVTGKV